MFLHFGDPAPKGYDLDPSCCARFVVAHGPHHTRKEPYEYVQPLGKYLRFDNKFWRPLAAKPEVGVAK